MTYAAAQPAPTPVSATVTDLGVDCIAFTWMSELRVWQWTCEVCGYIQLAGRLPLDEVVAAAGVHLDLWCTGPSTVEATAADGRTVHGHVTEDQPGRWRWHCGACPARSAGTYPGETAAREGLVRHVDALRPEVHP